MTKALTTLTMHRQHDSDHLPLWKDRHKRQKERRRQETETERERERSQQLTWSPQTKSVGSGRLAVLLALLLLLGNFLRHPAEVEQAVAQFVVQAEEQVPVGVAKEQRVVLVLLQQPPCGSDVRLNQH